MISKLTNLIKSNLRLIGSIGMTVILMGFFVIPSIIDSLRLLKAEKERDQLRSQFEILQEEAKEFSDLAFRAEAKAEGLKAQIAILQVEREDLRGQLSQLKKGSTKRLIRLRNEPEGTNERQKLCEELRDRGWNVNCGEK